MQHPIPQDEPVDPRGGFGSSPEGCVNGTGWGGKMSLNGDQDIEAPYADYQGHHQGGGGGDVTIVVGP